MKFAKCFLFFIILSSCARITFGEKPKEYDENIAFTQGKEFFGKNKLELRYIYIEGKNKNGIIFYLHGFNRTEEEWAENNGFGSKYYAVLKNNPDLPDYSVVAISFSSAFMFLEDAPEPYSDDIETIMIKEIIPYFKTKLDVSSEKTYLIGHSLGGYNALSLSMRNPDIFPVVCCISPYTAPFSPWDDDFEKTGKKLKMSPNQIFLLKSMLTNAFGSKEKWNEYNPFYLLENNDKFPFIVMSSATEDLPGFNWSVNLFAQKLTEKGIPNISCETNGDHWTTCEEIFTNFLKKIAE